MFAQIPNILSGYRLLTFPFLLYCLYAGEREWFVLCLSINLITDILDGFIARTFKLESEFGAKLDSLADVGSHIAAFTAFFVLEPAYTQAKLPFFLILLGLYIAFEVVALIRFGSTTHFHMYLMKTAGYFQGIYFFWFFNWGCPDWYFYIMFVASCLAFGEQLVVALTIPKLRSNVKGIYWMIKEKGRIE